MSVEVRTMAKLTKDVTSLLIKETSWKQQKSHLESQNQDLMTQLRRQEEAQEQCLKRKLLMKKKQCSELLEKLLMSKLNINLSSPKPDQKWDGALGKEEVLL